MSDQQRRHRRYDVDGVEGTLVYSLDARILNMSLTGMAIETTTSLRMGSPYWLRVDDGEIQLRFKANVMWCKLVRSERDANGDVRAIYHAGIDFREILDEHARTVLSFLEKHIVLEVDRRINGRFRLASGDRAALTVRHSFDVRRLSLGGLLVETVWEPPIDSTVELEVQAGERRIEARARVRSVHPVPVGVNEPPLFAVGLAFEGLSPEAEQALGHHIQGVLE